MTATHTPSPLKAAPPGARVTRDELEHLVTMATRAPSVHNTQPWTFTPVSRGLLLSRDRSRQLSLIDPEGRELLVSCGAAIDHLVVAARAVGIDAGVELFPPDESPDAIALVTLIHGAAPSDADVRSAVAILHRHTYRGRFSDVPLSPAVLEQLRPAVEARKGLLRVIREDELVELEVIVSRAESALQHTAGYAEELSRWVWHGTEDSARGDGLPRAAVDHGASRAESLEGRQFDGRSAPRPVDPPQAEHPATVLLSTLGDTPTDWVTAGRALSSLLLAAAGLGLAAQPFGQVIDVPSSRQALSGFLRTVGFPQLLRLGYGPSIPVTPRRPVADVLG